MILLFHQYRVAGPNFVTSVTFRDVATLFVMSVKDLIEDVAVSDEQVVQRVRDGETFLFEIIMRRYNQRLFRVIRGILKDENETEEVMQEAYVRAYEHLNQFAGRSKFSTWLTKIAVYEAYGRVKSRQRTSGFDDYMEQLMASSDRSPEQRTFDAEMRSFLESAVDSLPSEYRSVLMMRDVEGMSTAETADCLNITAENVKVRLFRARAMIRRALFDRAGAASAGAFQFLGPRCDRIVQNVLQRIQGPSQV
jgi:RNA polymerase sigma-70 factor (ECF subfamily)